MDQSTIIDGAVICAICHKPIYLQEEIPVMLSGEPVHLRCAKELNEEITNFDKLKDIDDIIA